MGEKDRTHFLVEQLIRMMYPAQSAAAREEHGLDADAARAFIHFMDEMPGGFLLYRADGDEEIIYGNRGLLQIFACETKEEFFECTGGSFPGMVYPEDLEAVERSIAEQIAASQYDLDYVEYRIRRRDGAIRWIEDYGHFVHVDGVGGLFYVFLGDATDKRERQASEQARLLSEKREKEQKIQRLTEEYDKERSLVNQEYLQQLEVIEGLSINYESICYVNLDRDRVVPYRLSRRNAGLLSSKEPQSYSRYIRQYIDRWVHPEDRGLVERAAGTDHIRKRLEETRTYYVNYRVCMEDECQYLQLRVVNVGRQDRTSEVVMGYRRVDEEIQQQMEQQTLLAEALAKANLAITSKNAFLSNMSHDMRTPLHAIFGFIALAKMNLDHPQEALDYLERSEAASQQLLDMIDKVLEVSALSDAPGLEEAECSLREVVGEVYRNLLSQAQVKDVAFAMDCGGLRHDTVFTDRDKLRQLLLYLATNAVTYTKPGGRVDISAQEGEKLPNQYAVYRFVVRDTGVGMSPEFLERIFEPFSRERNSTQSGVHGIGLGLTIAKNIVDLMGGNIAIESAPGQGSTFTVTITFRYQGHSAEAPRPAVESGRDFRRLLLVEDNEINREIEEELLENMGFIIDTAENGREAVEKLQSAGPGAYDLVLMDLQMPVMDGWKAAEVIRALPDPGLSKIPIVALSANMLESDQQRSKECGMNAHLFKPMNLPLVLKTIDEMTRRPREF